MEFNMEYILTVIALSAIAIQVVISSLSLMIKKIFKLEQPLKYLPFLYAVNWGMLIGPTWFYILSPFIFLIIGVLFVHKLMTEMLECIYCTSFNLTWVFFLLYHEVQLIEALLWGGISLVVISILDKLMS